MNFKKKNQFSKMKNVCSHHRMCLSGRVNCDGPSGSPVCSLLTKPRQIAFSFLDVAFNIAAVKPDVFSFVDMFTAVFIYSTY